MGDERDLDPGTPGASARREHDRRKANREQRTRKQHPRIGGALLALRDAPQHEKQWATGAAGEEAVAQYLARHCPEANVLHDRHMPGSRANIDHLAIAASGVYVIDAKRYKGKIEVRKPLFSEPKLVIAGRDKTKLVDGLTKQVSAVQSAIEQIAPEAPVHGCFCFVNPEGPLAATELPLLHTLSIKGYPLLYPRKLAKRLNQPGELSGKQTLAVAKMLSQRFPSA